MTEETTTTIKVPKALRDRLHALADEGGRGTTLADVLRELLEEHDSIRTRQLLAFDTLLQRAQADQEAKSKADQTVQRALAYLQRRPGGVTT
ncbi:MAG: hypothetical protein HOW59_21680 [Nonomuraea sp.]|nr:hypothetical protein [Nonomuraea sp.]